MKFHYDSELYDLDDGRVIAKFTGCMPFTPTAKMLAQFPNTGPMVKWEFEIMNGPDVAKPCATITPARPTPKNSCMRMLSALARRQLADKDDVDSDAYKGLFYAVSIIDGYVSNKFPPQYLGKDFATALRTFDPDATLPELSQDVKDEPVPF